MHFNITNFKDILKQKIWPTRVSLHKLPSDKCFACDPEIPGYMPGLYCKNLGSPDHFTYYTEDYSDEQVYIYEEMKKVAICHDLFDDLLCNYFEYRAQVVEHFESVLKMLTQPDMRQMLGKTLPQ